MLQNIAMVLFALVALIAVLISIEYSRTIGKWMGYLCAALVLFAAAAYAYFMRPINVRPAPKMDGQALAPGTRDALARLDFHLGAGTYTVEDIKHHAFADLFSSYTAINALKIGAVLKDPGRGTYDFSQADRFVDEALRQISALTTSQTLSGGPMLQMTRQNCL